MEKDKFTTEITERIAQGETRDSISAQLGYVSRKSLDMKMRRKCYRWDAHLNNYAYSETLEQEKETEEPSDAMSQADMIASELSENNADPKIIARRYGFHDHKELAIYMKCQGYEWNSSDKYYVKSTLRPEVSTTVSRLPASRNDFITDDEDDAGLPKHKTEPLNRPRQIDELERFIPTLQLLMDHKHKLEELLNVEAPSSSNKPHANTSSKNRIGRSKRIPVALNEIIDEYCHSKGLSPDEALESITTEFLNRYGYDYEVNLTRIR